MIGGIGWPLARAYLLTLPAAIIFTTRHWPEIVVLRSVHGMASTDYLLGIYGLMDAIDVALLVVTGLVALAVTFRHRLPTHRVRREVA